MTREECKQILMILDACYPNFHIESLTDTINGWYVLLADYEYKDIESALKIYVATSGSSFAPSVAELIASTTKVKELTEVDAVTAWSQVRMAIRDSYYGAEDYFEEFSETTKKVVGSPSQLRSWGQMETGEIDTVVWSNFKKSYEAVQKRNREISTLPKNIKNLIANTDVKMIEGGC